MSTPNPNTLPPRKRHRSPSIPNGPPAEDTLQYDLDECEGEEEIEEVVEEVIEEIVEEVLVEEEIIFGEEHEEEAASDRSRKGDSGLSSSDAEEERSGRDDDPRRKRRKLDYSVEVCRDFTKKSCFRSEIDCKFAHPHSHVAIEGDRVTACADSLRGACYRGRTCKYYHPPPHIQERLRDVNGISDPSGRTVGGFLRFARISCGGAARGAGIAVSHIGPWNHELWYARTFYAVSVNGELASILMFLQLKLSAIRDIIPQKSTEDQGLEKEKRGRPHLYAVTS